LSGGNEYSQEKILVALHFVGDLLGTADFIYDVFFTQERMLLRRLGRKSLCRVAIGMSGVTSAEETSILQDSEKSKNLQSIPYSELLHLTLSIDSNSRRTLQLQFVKRRSMILLLDKNQFDSMKVVLPSIDELRNRITVSSGN
jgi:hypothetical protein